MKGDAIMSANEMAKFITELIFEEKETILKALENNDAQTLEDAIYEDLQNIG